MQEYISDALVLALEPQGAEDARVTLFTRKFGKLAAKVKSARKIISKLSPHLTEGNFVQARIVEKGGLQLVDALKISKSPLPREELARLREILADAEPDQRIWHEVASGKLQWKLILKLLGWDPAEAACVRCGGGPQTFRIASQEFLCKTCALKSANGAVQLT